MSTKKRSVYDRAKDIGYDSRRPKNFLPRLAFAAARAAATREAHPEDARDIYMAYLGHVKAVTSEEDVSLRVQISKLRQIMEMAAHPGVNYRALMDTVSRLHKQEHKVGLTLYGAFVIVSRETVQAGRVPSERRIRELICRDP